MMLFCSEEGLKLETSASTIRYGGKFSFLPLYKFMDSYMKSHTLCVKSCYGEETSNLLFFCIL